MQQVQFESADIHQVLCDFAVLGIPANVEKEKIVARYRDWRSAEKLRTYLESHHCFMTKEGVIRTHEVDGWETLVAATHNSIT